MNITEFIDYLKKNKIKYRKRGDDICVDNVIYQFGYDGKLLGKVLPYNQEYTEII